ncbi:HDOD domain-containing protein [Undibacterium sp. TJN25]|uniref:HDOD domain-containing protein n=1 Tax=Undibacterium sp. TJN25 TaxID=3413056 RepID=UPI003BEF9202
MNSIIAVDVIRKIQDLPALSAIVTELLSSMDQEEVDVDSIAKKISHDLALTAKTLRLANSSFYGMQHKITSIQEAIAVLGFRSVRTLITTTAITGSFNRSRSGLFDFRAFWRHSIATAVCAKQLARHAKSSEDHAFIAGLLHDIGKLVLATRYEEQYEQVILLRAQRDCYIQDAEREILAIDHAMVGKALTEYWKFPEEMQEAVAHHHDTEHAESNMLTVVVHVGDAIAHALDLAEDEEALVPRICTNAWDKLKLTQENSAAIFKETEKQFEEICRILIN